MQETHMATRRRTTPRLGQESKLKQTSAIMIRVNDEHRRLMEQAAAMSGLSTSAWARMKLLELLRKEGK